MTIAITVFAITMVVMVLFLTPDTCVFYCAECGQYHDNLGWVKVEDIEYPELCEIKTCEHCEMSR